MQSSIVSGQGIEKGCDDLAGRVEELLNELLVRQEQQKLEEEEAEKVRKLQEEMEREKQQRKQEEERRRKEDEVQKQSARKLAQFCSCVVSSQLYFHGKNRNTDVRSWRHCAKRRKRRGDPRSKRTSCWWLS